MIIESKSYKMLSKFNIYIVRKYLECVFLQMTFYFKAIYSDLFCKNKDIIKTKLRCKIT